MNVWHLRGPRIRCAAFVAISLWVVGSGWAQITPAAIEPPPVEWRSDATLRDVFFLNHDLGWAAGDHGTILRTADGGRSWTQCPVDVACSLRSICFIDEQNGWAAGGLALPMLPRTQAVLLRTRDGGRSWQPINGVMLPAIHRLRMTDAYHGWAWGSPTELFPGGIFQTVDGGRSWNSFSQPAAKRWTAVAIAGSKFAVAGDDARLGTVENGQFRESQQLDWNTRYEELVFFDQKNGWAMGDRNLMISDDGGNSWRAREIPDSLGPIRFQFRTAARAGDRTWVAGSPGSYIFWHDETHHRWSRTRTPIRAGIHQLFFIDPQHGWAVGEGGAVLVTRDGGVTWQSQRAPIDRVAVLFICSSAAGIPLDLLARYSADQGYLAAVAVLNDRCEWGDGAQRAFEACQLQGVSVFDVIREPPGAAQDRRLVGWIRQLQPTVVIVADDADVPAAGSAGDVADLPTIVARAISQAADANHDREWVNHAALPAWHVRYGLLARQRETSLRWGSAEYLPTIGQNVADQTLVGRALLARNAAPIAGSELVTLNEQMPFSNSDVWSSLTNGAQAPPQRSARPQRGHIGQVKTIINKRETLDQLASQFDSSPASRAVWRQRIERLMTELAPRIAGDWLWQLSEEYAQSNRMELAALAREALLANGSGHPLAWEARLWLAHYYASEETAWLEFQRQQQFAASPQVRRDAGVQRAGLRAIPKTEMIDGVPHLVWTPELPDDSADTSDPRADISGQSLPMGPADFVTFYGQRLQRSLALFRAVRQFDPELSADPLVAYAESVLKRKQEGLVAAENDLRKVKAQQLPASHRAMIARELRLCGTRTWSQMRDLADCAAAGSKPYLDGSLDDEMWRSQIEAGQLMVLAPDVASQTGDAAQAPRAVNDPSLGRTQIMLAHDDQFLYVAAICHGGSPADPPGRPSGAARQRDGAMDPRDQLQWGIDIDRDGRHYYQFVVDARGNFGEGIAGNRDWNPTWYLAHRGTGESWTIEAAIPLDQLADAPSSAAETIWGLAVRRLRPDGLVERWSPVLSEGTISGAANRLTDGDFFPSDGVFLFR